MSTTTSRLQSSRLFLGVNDVTEAPAIAVQPLANAWAVEPVPTVPAYSPLNTELSPVSAPTLSSRLVYQSSTPVQTAPREPEPIAVAPSTGQQILGTLKSIGTNILDTVKATGEATVRGALEGGVTASTGARQGATVGAGFARLDFAVVAAAILALILLLRK